MNPESNHVVIFTDGSSRGNPGPGGFGAIVIAPKIHDSGFMIHELGGREERTTNNRMELRAAIGALRFLQGSTLYREKGRTFSISIYTDSKYLLEGITKWVFGWQKNNWKTKEKQEVLNRDLWETLAELTGNTKQTGKIEWIYVGGHVGIAGNERCDVIARTFADMTQTDAEKKLNLYSGALADYPIKNILDIKLDETLAAEKKEDRERSKTKAYSYLSMIDGEIMTHKTWAECEGRVKGVRGARFKKALSPEEEKAIIAEWRNG